VFFSRLFRRKRKRNRKCEHVQFVSEVDVIRIVEDERSSEVIGYTAEVNVRCADCGQPFRFIGLPVGTAGEIGTMSADCLEARLPIEPDVLGTVRLSGRNFLFHMAGLPTRH
jgi:hypothetical protein